MDQIIQPTIVLLILSLITEKIANFFKLQYEKTVDKESSIETEKERERKIQKLTIVVGVCVALLSKANLFEMFKSNYDLFWTGEDFKGWNLLSNIIGSLISGMFLSLGSKFFHDLLDTLIQVKNLKRKLNDKADWDFQNIKEFDDYVKEDDIQKLKSHVEDFFNNKDGYLFHEIDYSNEVILVHVQKGAIGFKDFIQYKSLTGKNKVYKVQIVEEERDIKALSVMLNSYDEIANQEALGNYLKGSIACPVLRKSDHKIFVLTCYHAVWNEKHDWDIFLPVGKEQVVHPLNGSSIGSIKYAFKNKWLDVALIEPNTEISIEPSQYISKPKSIRKIDSLDNTRKTSVKILSLANKGVPSIGYIDDFNVSANIMYPDGIKRRLENLIRIKPKYNTAFSVGGDSGALVVDEWNYAVGMVVAGNEGDVTFAIPIDVIFDNLNIKIQ